MIEDFQRYVDKGRSYGAKSYSITSDTMEAILVRMKADHESINRLRELLSTELRRGIK